MPSPVSGGGPGRGTALFIPPFAWRLWLTSAGAWEQAGERWFTRFSGVVLIEAGKQIYAPTPVRATPVRARRLRPQPALGQPASCPGLTRAFTRMGQVPEFPRLALCSHVDGRVKPGHDGKERSGALALV